MKNLIIILLVGLSFLYKPCTAQTKSPSSKIAKQFLLYYGNFESDKQSEEIVLVLGKDRLAISKKSVTNASILFGDGKNLVQGQLLLNFDVNLQKQISSFLQNGRVSNSGSITDSFSNDWSVVKPPCAITDNCPPIGGVIFQILRVDRNFNSQLTTIASSN